MVLYLVLYNLYHYVFWNELALPLSKKDLFHSRSIELVLGTASMGILSLIVETVRNVIGKRSH